MLEAKDILSVNYCKLWKIKVTQLYGQFPQATHY